MTGLPVNCDLTLYTSKNSIKYAKLRAMAWDWRPKFYCAATCSTLHVQTSWPCKNYTEVKFLVHGFVVEQEYLGPIIYGLVSRDGNHYHFQLIQLTNPFPGTTSLTKVRGAQDKRLAGEIVQAIKG